MLKIPRRMEEVLLMASQRKMREVDIAAKLGVTKQAVSKSLREARARLTQIFLTVAELLNSDIARINVEKGFMILRNRQTGARLYVIYVPGQGPLVLFAEKIECTSLNKPFCEKLVKAAKSWGIVEQYDNLEEAISTIIGRMEE
ncbi:MAG: hypothetical protein DRJ55_05385 [Thermoprotei archaeon]|nr:MAG: hypothetical protein DRJ46_03030 [Thermoprotei archaeon]RLE91681.1 MAG: hypothetical protein DRJ55_05385 [Thermoprotei archaeon]